MRKQRETVPCCGAKHASGRSGRHQPKVGRARFPLLFCIAALLIVLLALAAAWTARYYLMFAMARWLDVGEQPRPAQYVMVLTGDEDTRPFVAATLIKAWLAREALVAETKAADESDAVLPDAHEVVRAVLLKRGVAPGAIHVLPGAASTTHDEAGALATFVRRHPKARVLVVTNAFHTRRSRWIMTRALGDQAGRVTMVSAPIDEFDIARWWRSETGFSTITAEYFKLGFYLLRYSRFGWWLLACGVLVLVAKWVRRRQRDGGVGYASA